MTYGAIEIEIEIENLKSQITDKTKTQLKTAEKLQLNLSTRTAGVTLSHCLPVAF